MSSPIRITGLITFLVIFIGFFATASIAIDPIASQVLRSAGSEAVGAKVELDSAEISLVQQSVSLNQLAIADPKCSLLKTPIEK